MLRYDNTLTLHVLVPTNTCNLGWHQQNSRYIPIINSRYKLEDACMILKQRNM